MRRRHRQESTRSRRQQMRLVGTAGGSTNPIPDVGAALARRAPSIDLRSGSPVLDLRDDPRNAPTEVFGFGDSMFVDLCTPTPAPVESEMLRILRGDVTPRRKPGVPPPGHHRS